jgi:phenylacetate-CoA ligase
MAGLPERLWWTGYAFCRGVAAERLPRKSPKAISDLQNRRVRSMVTHAWQSVPHYRDAMKDTGLRPDDIDGVEALVELPLIDGSDLAAEPDRFYSDRYAPADTLTIHSSGTTGRPKAVRYDKSALFHSLALGQRQRAVVRHFTGRKYGYREMPVVRSGGVPVQMRQFYERHYWVPGGMELQRSRVTVDTPFEELLLRIGEFRPDVVSGYGSHLGAFFRWVHDRGLDMFIPRLVSYGADAMPAADRDLIETGFGIPVLSSYQADEALRIAFQCRRRRGFHVSMDAVAVRVMRPDGSTAGPGETGEIVISNLSNRATVLLNYRLGDLVRVPDEPCDCGSTLPTIGDIAGRADDLIALPDGQSLHSLALLQPLQQIPGVARVQIVQEDEDRLSIRAVCESECDWARTAALLSDTARGIVGKGFEVSAERFDEIPRERSGKTRAVISNGRPR